jgi:hypothetical protein
VSGWKTVVADKIVTCLIGGVVTNYQTGVDHVVLPGPKTISEMSGYSGYSAEAIRMGIAECRDRGDLLTCDRRGNYRMATTAPQVHEYRRMRLKPIVTGIRRLYRLLDSAAVKCGSPGAPDVILADCAGELGRLANRLERVMNRP